MYYLAIIVTFSPFMWGDSSVTVKELPLHTKEACLDARKDFQKTRKDERGYYTYDSYCIYRGSDKTEIVD